MFNTNSGYVGESMSRRAAAAYENGEKPLSKWTKGDIIARIAEKAEEDGEEIPNGYIANLKKVSLENLKIFFLKETSCHHTGKFYNETKFYDVILEMNLLPDVEKLIFLTNEEEEEKKKEKEAKKARYCIVTYFWTENRGSRNYPKIYECSQNFLAIVKGETAELIETYNHKKVRNFKILHEFQGKQRKNAKEKKMIKDSYQEERRKWRRY